MLTRLSIRDIVLIDRLDIDFAPGLSVLTGETGAGKSILLDAFALALGARGDSSLVRRGAEQGQVTAAFDVPIAHPARAILRANAIPAEDELILRRVQLADGRTRAFLNDQPVAAGVLRGVGQRLVEIHGQHDDRALVDSATHRLLLDAYGGLEAQAAEVGRLWAVRRDAQSEVARHRAEVERAEREAEWLRHAAGELRELAPQPGEETQLAERRTHMMQAEKVAEDLREAEAAVAGPASPVPMLSAAVRRLERRRAQAAAMIDPASRALDAALAALDDARHHIEQALAAAAFDPQALERIEERLFALRAAARKYNAPVDELAALAARYGSDLARLDAGAERLVALEAEAAAAADRYAAAGEALSAQRRAVATELDRKVNARSCEILDRDRDRAGSRRDRGRSGRILGPHQSWHRTGALDEGRLRRRARPLHAGPQGGDRRPRLGADAGVRRDRYWGRRRGCGRRRHAARAPRRPGAGLGRHPCAAGRGARRPPLSHHQGCAQRQAGCDAYRRA
jgi:DNA repair protein RecN (Recombination protein N)